MKNFLLSSFIVLCSLSSFADRFQDRDFPKGPENQVTPGDLCKRPNGYRYPERIPYCNRNVDSGLKNDIIDNYDRQFGYKIRQTGRGQFKIDHLIPLCAGGSNEEENLWPQHKSVYEITDPLEPAVCDKMAMGRLRQEEAVRLVLEAKHNLDRVPAILSYIQDL